MLQAIQILPVRVVTGEKKAITSEPGVGDDWQVKSATREWATRRASCDSLGAS